MLQLPPRGERGVESFSFLTTIRDPIERIGSQAFYGSQSVGHIMIKEMLTSSQHPSCKRYTQMSEKDVSLINPTALSSNCGKDEHSEKNVNCICFADTIVRAMENIRNNESIWFNWIHNVVGFSDAYMPNYFIKRLVQHTGNVKNQISLASKFFEGLPCTMNPGDCKIKDKYALLRSLFPTRGCMLQKDMSQYNITEALSLAKQVLQFQLDFIITEHFDDPRTVHALELSLQNGFSASSTFMQRKDNGGVMTSSERTTYIMNGTVSTKAHNQSGGWKQQDVQNSGSIHRRRLKVNKGSYRFDMPPAILKYLEQDNAADIEFYKFAVNEFERRSRMENWIGPLPK